MAESREYPNLIQKKKRGKSLTHDSNDNKSSCSFTSVPEEEGEDLEVN